MIFRHLHAYSLSDCMKDARPAAILALADLLP